MKLLLALAASLALAGLLVQGSESLRDFEEIGQWGSVSVSKPGHFLSPEFLAVGQNDTIYLSNIGNKNIQQFTTGGEFIFEWGSSGKKPGEFYHPSGIAVTNDSVFVVDRDLNRVQKFGLDGEFLTQWGGKGGDDGKFFFPRGIAHYNGTIYVVDTGNKRVQMFDTDGQFIRTFGSGGLEAGQFITPADIDIDDDGSIYIADRGLHKVEKFTPDGVHARTFDFYYEDYVFAPELITVDPAGDMFIFNGWNSQILHIPQDARLLLSPAYRTSPLPDSYDMISDMVITESGQLVIVEPARHQIKLFETPFYNKTESFEIYKEPQVQRPVADRTKPMITAPESRVVEAADRLTVVDIGMANASDASGIRHIINNAPDAFGPGISNVVWIAFDNNAHTSDVYQTVEVKTCGNKYSEYNWIEGTSGNDVLNGTDGDDLIFGLAGDDTIFGGAGDDCIFGGDGNDVILGNAGRDAIRGNAGDDIINGQQGVDIIYPGAGSDTVDGGDGSDRCYSDSDKDVLKSC